MRHAPAIGFAAGLASALLFLFTLPPSGGTPAAGVAFPLLHFLALVPLMAAIFLGGVRAALVGPVVGGLTVVAGTQSHLVFLLYALMVAGPALVLGWMAVQKDAEGQDRFSVGRMIEVLVYIAAAIMTFYAFSFRGGEQGLEAALKQQIDNSIAYFNQQEGGMVDPRAAQMVRNLAFLLPSGNVWMWVAMVMVHAWAGFWLAGRLGTRLRAAFRLEEEPGPGLTLLGLLFLSGIAAFAGGAELAFLGKVMFIIFLLPYFVAGIRLVHQKTRAWPGRGMVLAALYFSMLLLLWPVLAVAMVAVVRQTMALNDSGTKK